MNIKFKVWDSGRGEFTGEHGIFYISESGELFDGWDGEEPIPVDKKYLAVFSIGQHNENGVEIYEGDIIKTPGSGGNIFTVEKGLDTIVRRVDVAVWSYRMSERIMTNRNGSLQCEIIGNKYENPELLEK